MLNGIKTSLENTVDFKKIQKVADQASVEILVGFPGGQEHVPTLHKNDFERPNEKRRGKYVGLHGEDPADQEPMEVAELARMLHYGTADIPARPFLEDGIKQNLGKIKKAFKEEVEKVMAGGKANWDKVGTMAVGAIDEFVRSDYYKQRVPNAKSTIRWKGSDTPLIDGANMIQSLNYVINGVTK